MARHGFHEIMKNSLKKQQYASALFLMMGSQLSWALPQPGSQITNIASGDFADAQGNVQIVDSNPVSLTIQKVLALDLTQDQQQNGNIGAKLNFPHLLTNIGNSADDYQLNLTQATDDSFDLTGVAVYADRDQNGLPDDNVNLLLAGSSIRLEAGKSLAVVVAGTVPATASAGQQARFVLKATSNQNNAITDSVNDAATVVDDAVLQVTKAQSISGGVGNNEITYTLTYTNTGTAAGKLLVRDTLNSALQYKTGSALWSNGSGALTDANDGTESGANSGINYRVLSGNQIEFELASIAALSTGSVSFKVQVANTTVDSIPNTATYNQYDNSNNVTKNTSTNTVIYANQLKFGVVANIRSGSSSNGGNPNMAPDNLTVINSATAGQEVLFDDYIWNTGSASDIYNLSFSANNLPACARVRLYGSDGKTLLVDSNGDGVIDTGTVAAGSVRAIKLGISSTPDCTASTAISVDLLARSVTDTTVSDAVLNQLNSITTSGSTDLYNSDNSGTGVGNVDNGGNAFISKTISSGGKAVFPLVINNTGSKGNNYNLYASSTAINLNNPVSTLPAGWTVSFFEGDATCTTLGAQITNSGNVPASTTKQYCAVVQTGANINNTTLPIWFAIKSVVNQQGDVVKNQVVVQANRNLSLVSDQQGQVQTGGTIVYLHTLKNQGTVQEGTSAGQVKLEIQPLNANDGFSYTLYYDANNNGVLDNTDVIATDLATITANSGLAPEQSIQLLVKVQAPVTATNGMSSQATLVVTPVGQVQGLNAAIVKNTDNTIVSSNQLRLTKSQVKDDTCSASTYNSLTYSTVPVQVKPNQCVIYQLSVKNEGASSVNAVFIQDVVPVYTTLRNSPAPSASQGTVKVSGDQIRADIGTVASGQNAALYFSIRVNP